MNAEHDRQKLLKESDGRALIKHCEKKGAATRWGKGDHCIVIYKSQCMPIPARTIGHGLQSKIVKWIFAVGLAALGGMVFLLVEAF